MNIGEYIRTPYGIGKITSIYKGKLGENSGFCIDSYKNKINCSRSTLKVLKSSPNIIDLIEENDYVNGSRVIFVDKELKCVIVSNSVSESGLFYEKDIKSIVTKEQFESMEYKIGE